MKNESLRNPIFLKSLGSSTPSSIDSSTYDASDVFSLCRFFNENGVQDLTHCISLNNQRFVIEKVVNYLFVCFTVKYHQFEQTKRRSIKFGNEFWLYHHDSAEFKLFLTFDNEVPNGYSANRAAS